jgi:hypothetical protein
MRLTGRRIGTVAALAAITAIVAAVLLVPTVQQPLAERGAQSTAGPFWLGRGSTTASAFRALGLPAKTEIDGDIEVVWMDGNMPEMVTANVRSLLSAPDVIAHYEAACRRIGLAAPPPADWLKSEPDLLCGGRYKGYSIRVTATPISAGEETRIHLWLQGI